MTNKKIVFTGGGSAGHVTPNIAIIKPLRENGWDITYIGSKNGIEKEIIEKENIPFFGISSGKLRRYFDWKNFTDPFRILKGVGDAYQILRKQKPAVVFSKGGFVTVPVVMAAKMLKIPVIIHESDITPGLANKIATKFATRIFVTFEETAKYLPVEKVLHVGSPIRKELFQGDAIAGRAFVGLHEKKPIITIMGGSLGAKKINEAIRASLSTLTESFQLIHITGKGNVDETLASVKGYKQYEYISSELPDVLAATDFVISRAGSNSIFEFLALKKPMLLIPLSRNASRGDQILNAKSFMKKGYAQVLMEEDLTTETMLENIKSLVEKSDIYIHAMEQNETKDTLDVIVKEIISYSR